MKSLFVFLAFSTAFVGTCNAALYKLTFTGGSLGGWTMSGSVTFDSDDLVWNYNTAEISTIATVSPFVWTSALATYSSSPTDIVVDRFVIQSNQTGLTAHTVRMWSVNPTPEDLDPTFWISNGSWNAGVLTGSDTVQGGSYGVPPVGTWSVAEPVTPVPLPASAWLFGSALAGLIGFKRKK